MTNAEFTEAVAYTLLHSLRTSFRSPLYLDNIPAEYTDRRRSAATALRYVKPKSV
jgi:hypothetical protein